MTIATRISEFGACEVCGSRYRILDCLDPTDGTWHPRCADCYPDEFDVPPPEDDKAIIDGYEFRAVSNDYHDSKGGR